MHEDNAPCLNCKDRKVYSFNGRVSTCHATCERYIKAVQRDRERKAMIREAKAEAGSKRIEWTKSQREQIAGRYGRGRKR